MTLHRRCSLRPEVFYYVGCVSSYRETEIPVALVSIFEKLRIPFTLSQEEWCCGAPLYFSGHEEKAYKLAEHNVDAVKKSGASTVVLSCPTCSMIFKRYYPRWLKKDLGFDVLHVSEFLEGLYGEGRLKFRPAGAGKVAAYHDPCHLGRGQGIYDAPRRVLRAIEGIEFRDPGRTMENSFCCGGGGLLPTGSPEFSDQLARERAAEMKETGAEWLVSACPACKESLKIAARTLKRGIKVMDLVELVDKNLAV